MDMSPGLIRFTDDYESPADWNKEVGVDKKLMLDYIKKIDQEICDLREEIDKLHKWKAEALNLLPKLPDE